MLLDIQHKNKNNTRVFSTTSQQQLLFPVGVVELLDLVSWLLRKNAKPQQFKKKVSKSTQVQTVQSLLLFLSPSKGDFYERLIYLSCDPPIHSWLDQSCVRILTLTFTLLTTLAHNTQHTKHHHHFEIRLSSTSPNTHLL